MSWFKTPTPAYDSVGPAEPKESSGAFDSCSLFGRLDWLIRTPTPAYESEPKAATPSESQPDGNRS